MPDDDTPDVGGSDDEGRPPMTDDGRYVLVGGRRWRAADPSLPEETAAALRSELGRARSSIRAGQDPETVAAWRARVQLAKEGLGERGTAWWELSETERRDRAAARLTRLRETDVD